MTFALLSNILNVPKMFISHGNYKSHISASRWKKLLQPDTFNVTRKANCFLRSNCEQFL